MGTTDGSFTGQTQDAALGIYDLLFRQHSAAQGRWLVPDPAGLAAVDPTNPQTWNRYAYVMNNPLSAVDLLGLANDCGGPCTPFTYSAGGCTISVSYIQVNVSYGGSDMEYDMPVFAGGCGDGSSGLGPGMGPSGGPVGGGGVGGGNGGNGQPGQQPTSKPNAANNGSWWSALKHSPWVVSWILPIGPVPGVAGVGPAGSFAWNPATKTFAAA